MIPAAVEIKWFDAAASPGWMTPEERNDWCRRTVNCLTVGYLVSVDAKCYTVATTWDEEQEKTSGLYQIPKGCVRSMKVLKKGKEGK